MAHVTVPRRRSPGTWPAVAALAFVLAFILALAPALAGAASPEVPDFGADRPGLADGSTVVGEGRVQVEVGLQLDETREAPYHEEQRSLPVLLRYGIDDRLELRFEGGAWSRLRIVDEAVAEDDASGLGNVALGAKWNFQHAATGRPSLGAILRLMPPSGSGPFRTQHYAADLRVAADVDLGHRFWLNPNLGLGLEDDDGRYVTGLAAVTLTRELTSRLAAFVDVAAWSHESRAGGSAAVFDYGFTWLAGKNSQVDVSPGIRLHGETAANRFWTIGYSRRF